VHDAVMLLTEGSCDLLIAYHHPSQPLQLNPDRYEMLSVGQETLAPYARADAVGQPMFRLPAKPGEKVPFLSYASGAYLGRLVEQVIKLSPVPLVLDSIYETDMAEGLKAMALEGHGLAFLPSSSVDRETRNHRLVRASVPGACELSMEVRLYRERPEMARHTKPQAQALWDFLRDGGAPASA
jgi:LysR family transcriptional regulator, hypochlorite-specific transcription factor HypT